MLIRLCSNTAGITLKVRWQTTSNNDSDKVNKMSQIADEYKRLRIFLANKLLCWGNKIGQVPIINRVIIAAHSYGHNGHANGCSNQHNYNRPIHCAEYFLKSGSETGRQWFILNLEQQQQ